jgi:hypothetical protein
MPSTEDTKTPIESVGFHLCGCQRGEQLYLAAVEQFEELKQALLKNSVVVISGAGGEITQTLWCVHCQVRQLVLAGLPFTHRMDCIVLKYEARG